ncbi:MAG TPA: polysaccharide deacetylase family protein [Candidatus Angelobacter sp.]|nr:polysaccharide deacetylase family protein [Candidatus Angelobacter sp.]
MSVADAATQGMVLAYHEIMPQSNYAYCVPSGSFAAQLELLSALAANAGVRARVTFDDGEQSEYRNAGPLLSERGITATYFVNPGLVGTEAKFLGWPQLKEVLAAGHSVQSHGHSHKFLTTCSDAELTQDAGGSREMLEDRLGATVEEISMPGGRWDKRVIDACARAGYKRVFVSEPWIDTEIAGVKVIGRFMVRRTTTLAEFEKMVRRDPRALWRMKMRAMLRRRVIGVVGDELYHRLWCKLTGYNEFEAARQGRSS